MRYILITAALICATDANAEGLRVQFADGAPKDSLTFQNDGCPLTNATIVIDLRDTPAGLIFDVTSAGAGVEVFQPIEAINGDVSIGQVEDGDQVLQLRVPRLPKGDTIRLTADLDDTTSNRQITVTGSEMAGARVTLTQGETSQTAAFNTSGAAFLPMTASSNSCPSP